MKPYKKRRTYPAPQWSERIFVEVNPHDVHMFRYLLEAYDNLGYMSVVDRWRAVLRLSYSPHHRQEFMEALACIAAEIPVTPLPPQRENDDT